MGIDLPKSPLEGRAHILRSSDNIIDGHVSVIDSLPEHLGSINDKTKAQMAKSILKDTSRTSISDLFGSDVELNEIFAIDPSIADKHAKCMVCALPRRDLELLEKRTMLYQEDFDDVAASFSLTRGDVAFHIESCVLDRKASIPVGTLVNALINEANEFIARMSSFRLELDSSMNPEAINTYLSVLAALRQTVRDLTTMDSPNDSLAEIGRAHV